MRVVLFIVSLLIAALAGWEPATAADAAKRHIFGFSPDGKYFAFEEYGVQDGSGFPYANFYVIETETDTWFRGTPLRVLLRSRSATLQQARDELRESSQPYIWRINLGNKGRLIISDPAKRDIDAARFLAFTLPDSGDAQGLGTVRLRINQFAVESPHCATLGQTTKGFALVLEKRNGDPIRILHEDTSLPQSRGCALHYGLSDVIVFPRPGLGPVLVVLVSVYKTGFEGLDRRFMGIAATFDRNPSGSP